MRICPTCGAFYLGDTTVCPRDGAALLSGLSEQPLEATLPPPDHRCPRCGDARGSDEDGYCYGCGERLPPSRAPFAEVNGLRVIAMTDGGEPLVQLADGTAVRVVVGPAPTLRLEADALETLDGAPSVPRLLGRGHDPKAGDYLLLSLDPEGLRSPGNGHAAPSLSEVTAMLGEVLDVAERLARAGFAWQPSGDEVRQRADGGLWMHRLRGLRRLPAGERVDVRLSLLSVAGRFLPFPAMHAPTSLMHLLLPSRSLIDASGDADELRARLREVASAKAPPPTEPLDACVLTDPGLSRNYNQDAGSVRLGFLGDDPWAVMVVCDGVSSSPASGQAAQRAAKTAADVLARWMESSDVLHERADEAMATAIKSAHIDVCADYAAAPTSIPPGTTLVAAVLFRGKLTVGWVGDSRAYLLGESAPRLLTRDHSWVNEAIERGEMTETEALTSPHAHTITRCLGPLEAGDAITEVDPDVVHMALPSGSWVILCSDGLWNYAPSAADLAIVASFAGAEPEASRLALTMVNAALYRGGHDNVTVAVCRWAPRATLGPVCDMPFKIEAFQNRFLPAGATRVDGILSVSAQLADASPSAALVVGFLIDKSGSMAGDRIEMVVKAVCRAIDLLPDRASFFVVAFDANARLVVPETRATHDSKLEAARALSTLAASGGTAMSTALEAARRVFERCGPAIRQAVFLTDGKNESEPSGRVAGELARCEGLFQCDCWGVGTDWKAAEVQQIAGTLLGKASIIPDVSGVEEAFRQAIEKASEKAAKDVRVRLWTPATAQVLFFKQVTPYIDDLTAKARVVSPQVREYLTGAWGASESRDFQVAIEVKAAQIGGEMLALRPSVVYLEPGEGGWVEREDRPAEGRLIAQWSTDAGLTSRVDGHVAHYTGHAELADAIRAGLEQRDMGNVAGATQLLGRAVRLAHVTGNSEITQRLNKVVDVVDAATGTVRLRRDVKRAEAMELELESRTTRRLGRPRGAGS